MINREFFKNFLLKREDNALVAFIIKFYRKVVIKIYESFKRGNIKRSIHFLFSSHLIRTIKIIKFLKQDVVKLQVGGGRHVKDGWINGDLIAGDIYLNAKKKLPFPDNSVDFIFAEQFIEHISLSDGKSFIKESNRILKPGGVLRLATPDLFLLFEVYLDENEIVSQEEVLERHQNNHGTQVISPCHFINEMFRKWGHKFIYDYGTLKKILYSAGFEEVNRLSFGESSIEELQNLERHADTEWMKNAFQIILETKKAYK